VRYGIPGQGEEGLYGGKKKESSRLETPRDSSKRLEAEITYGGKVAQGEGIFSKGGPPGGKNEVCESERIGVG